MEVGITKNCHKHVSVLATHFCFHCSLLLCGECKAEHKKQGHMFDTIEDAAKDFLNDLMKSQGHGNKDTQTFLYEEAKKTRLILREFDIEIARLFNEYAECGKK